MTGCTGAQLDVLRAIAEAVLDGHIEPDVRAVATDRAVHAVAAARVQLDAEQADRRAIVHAGIGGIERIARAAHRQGFRIGRAHEAGRPREQRCPRIAALVDRARHDERQLREELAMLLRHVIAHDAPPDAVHALIDAEGFLNGDFARMPRRRRGGRWNSGER
jgi:hypothetical protein